MSASPAPLRSSGHPIVTAPAKAVAGQLVHLSGTGFSPGTQVKIVLDEPHKVVVASAVAQADGQFHASVKLPQAGTGRHTLQVEGTSTSGRRAVLATRVVVLSHLGEEVAAGPGLATPVLLSISIGLPIATWVVLQLPVWRRRPGGGQTGPGPGGS